jgi:hypothetical protein
MTAPQKTESPMFTVETHKTYDSAYASICMGYADGTFDPMNPPKIVETEVGEFAIQTAVTL